MSPRSRVSELKNAYAKATPAERAVFLDHLRRIGACASPSTTVAAPASSPRPKIGHTPSAARPAATAIPKKQLPIAIAVDGVLTPQAKERNIDIMDKKGLIGKRGEHRTGQVMSELGAAFSRRDPSLGSALHRNTKLTDEMLKALEDWICRNS